MPTTARSHFDDDIQRAWSMFDLAVETTPINTPRSDDIGRVSVAFGVGAMDAYLCDAFVDTLVRCLRSCRQNGHNPPDGYGKLELPIGPLMADYPARSNWGLRMATRALMERDNLLRLSRLKELLNPALPQGRKLWPDLAQEFVDLNRKRLAGYRKAEYNALMGKAKSEGPKDVTNNVMARMGDIVQRRHDIVHNCDRPKTAKQLLTLGQAKAMLADVHDFVKILDQHLDAHRIY
jgi:hypothetical protein